jgi:electron transfer flavoprotein alpha subunit
MARNILVVGERKNEALRKTALEALGAGRALAAKLGSEAHAALIGHQVGAAAGEFATCGAAVVHVVDDAAYGASHRNHGGDRAVGACG